YYSTLLKKKIEIDWLTAGHRVEQRLLRRRWRGVRPGLPAALQDSPGITPALHLPQRPGPGRRTRRRTRRGWRAAGGHAQRGRGRVVDCRYAMFPPPARERAGGKPCWAGAQPPPGGPERAAGPRPTSSS